MAKSRYTPQGPNSWASLAPFVAKIEAAQRPTQNLGAFYDSLSSGKTPGVVKSEQVYNPVNHVLNILSSLGYGVEGRIDAGIRKGKQLQEQELKTGKKISPWEALLEVNGAGEQGGADAFSNAISPHPDNDKLKSGSDIIEHATDMANLQRLGQQRGQLNPGETYNDVKDNVNPTLKAAGGLALDVGLDPTTWIPGGVLGAGIKGAVKGGVAAARAAGVGKDIIAGADKAHTAAQDAFKVATDAGGTDEALNAASRKANETWNKANAAVPTNGLGAVVGNAPGLVKTAAFLNPVTGVKGAGQGILKWGEEKTAKSLAKKVVADAKRTGTFADASDLKDLADNNAVSVNALLKQVAGETKKAAKKVKVPAGAEGARATEDLVDQLTPDATKVPTKPAADIVDDKALQTEIDDTSRAAEAETRQGLNTDPSIAAQASKAVPASQVVEFLRKLSGEEPKPRTAGFQHNAQALGPIPSVGDRLETGNKKYIGQRGLAKLAKDQAAWKDSARAIGFDDDEIDTLAKTNPLQHADARDALAQAKVAFAHSSDEAPSELFKKLKAKSRVYNEDDAFTNFMKSLGYDKRSMRKGESSLIDVARRVDKEGKPEIQQKYRAMLQAEKDQQGAFIDAGLPDAAAATATEAGMPTPEAVRGAFANDAVRLAADMKPGLADYVVATTGKTLEDAVGLDKDFPFKGATRGTKAPFKSNVEIGRQGVPGASVRLTHDWETHKTYAAFKQLIPLAKRIATGAVHGKAESASRKLYAAQQLRQMAKLYDTYLKSLGITPVSGSSGLERLLAKHADNPDFAALGVSDVLDVLPDELVARALFDSADNQIPITVLMDAQRWALKEGGTEGDIGDRIINLTNHIIKQGQKGLGSTAASKGFITTAKGKALAKDIATTLLQPDVLKKLTDRQVLNQAFLLNQVKNSAHGISDPVVDALQSVLRSPTASQGDKIDSIMDVPEELAKATKRAGLENDDTAKQMAKWDASFAAGKEVDLGTFYQTRSASRADKKTVVDASGESLGKEAVRRIQQQAEKETGGIGTNGKPRKAGSVAETDARRAATRKAREGAASAKSDDVKGTYVPIDEVLGPVAAAMKAAGETPGDVVNELDGYRAAMTMGLPGWMKMIYNTGTKLSGGFGYQDLHTMQMAAELSTRHQSHTYADGIAKMTASAGRDTMNAAFKTIQDISLSEGTNDAVDAAIAAAKGTAVGDAMEQLWPAVKVMFDNSEHTLFRRMGLDANDINDFLRKVGVPQHLWLTGNTQGWEVASQWKKMEPGVADELADEKLGRPYDAMDMLRDYNNAFNQARVLPEIGASFSAQFGHESDLFGNAMSREEARGRGWKTIDPKAEKGLGRYLDKDQLYPPQMLAQLSMMDQYFSKSRILNEDHFFDKAFRWLDPIINIMKTSITLWRPGHWVTNIMGEGLMNLLAGVNNPRYYADALAILKRGGALDSDGGLAIKKYLAESAPDGMQLKDADRAGVKTAIGGKAYNLSYDSVYRFLDQAGILLHHDNAEDLINESMDLYHTNSKGQKFLQKTQRKFSPNWLGEGSAQRDNVFRVAHAVHLLEHGSYKNLPDAMDRIAREVYSYHPNMASLSAFEQKYVRRIIYFYTWQRQALTRIMDSMITDPGRITGISKGLYAAGVAGGTDPESFGHPMPDDPRVPTYNQGLVNQAIVGGGLLGDDNSGEFQNLWGIGLNAPQMDVLQSVLGSIQIDPNQPLSAQLGTTAGQVLTGTVGKNLTPALKIPIELSTGSQIGGARISNGWNYLADQTGLSYPRKLGLLGPQSDDSTQPAEEQSARYAALLNFLSGARITNYTTAKSIKSATAQQNQMKEEALAQQGLLPQK